MRNTDAHLVEDLFADAIERAPTRDGFGRGTVEAGKASENVVVLCADLKESTRAEWFEKEFPDRFVEIGVAEQNLATVASGMAAVGKRPYIASYAAFSPGRNYEQIRTTIALNKQPVVVCGMHAGVSVGPDGATHQMLEDVGMMRMLPGMNVMVPGDAEEARKITALAATLPDPSYIRFGRSATPTFTTADTPVVYGKSLTLWEGTRPQVAILGTGAASYEALKAARALDAEGIAVVVVHFPFVKPLDADAILRVAKQTGRIVTIEEHQVAGGFGSAVTEVVSAHYPVPVTRLGVQDVFGQSGEPAELLEHYGITAPHITKAVKQLLRAS